MAKIKGDVRRSQIVTTYGIGSVVAFGDESFMVTGIDRWDEPPTEIHEPRLEREMRVQTFRLPPATDDQPDIPVVRFPVFHSCPHCRRLDTHSTFAPNDENECSRCQVPLVPSRFVVCCEAGHIEDFPYFAWLHGGGPRTEGRHEMSIDASAKTASLRDIELSCSCGTQPTNLDGAFSANGLVGKTRCHGRRPWLTGEAELCSLTPRALQRGASNVWYSNVRSALSIPPWSDGAYKTLNRWWQALRHVPTDVLPTMIEAMNITKGTPYTTEDMVVAVQQRKKQEDGSIDASAPELRRQEFDALSRGREQMSRDQDFVCVPIRDADENVSTWFQSVMAVKRLREVRVLESFSRIRPFVAGDPAERKAPLSREPLSWLPAIEVAGEGVFFRLDDQRLARWETRVEVRTRIRRMDEANRKRFQTGTPDPVTPRFVLLHTLAHALINQWSLDCGYPAASLRERIFSSPEMAGLLIYTATSDSAGSLGGVIGQASPDRLWPSVSDAVHNASWCSSDPLCVEAVQSGVDGLNLAACHACVLLPETSCEEMNVYLDRATLIGTPNEPSVGFFADVLTAV